MTREEQVAYCKVCKFKSFDQNKGIICKLTNEKADFENDCINFEGNRDEIIHPLLKSSNEGELDAKIKSFFKNKILISPLIVLINILIFIIMSYSGLNIFQPDSKSLLEWGANFKPVTLEGEYWRIFTNLFIHIGIFHLIFNMYALLVIGFVLEKIIGKIKFLLAYLVSGIAASITSLWYNNFVISAGASGAILGMYGILFVLVLTKNVKVKNRANLLTGLILFLGFNLLFGMKNGIDNAAHFGGLIMGFIIGILMIPFFLKSNLKIKNSAYFYISILIILISLSLLTLRIPDPYGKYDKLMTEFAEYESKAMLNYSSYENYSVHSNNYKIMSFSNKNDILDDIDYKAMPYWKKCKSIITEVKNIEELPENLQKNAELTDTYCNYRIEALKLLYKSIKLETTKYDLHILAYYNAIDKLIGALNGKNTPESSFKILTDKDLVNLLPNDFLYVVNGKPLNNKNKIILNDIQTVTFYPGEILKSLYGDKVKNGFFLISTNAK